MSRAWLLGCLDGFAQLLTGKRKIAITYSTHAWLCTNLALQKNNWWEMLGTCSPLFWAKQLGAWALQGAPMMASVAHVHRSFNSGLPSEATVKQLRDAGGFCQLVPGPMLFFNAKLLSSSSSGQQSCRIVAKASTSFAPTCRKSPKWF